MASDVVVVKMRDDDGVDCERIDTEGAHAVHRRTEVRAAALGSGVGRKSEVDHDGPLGVAGDQDQIVAASGQTIGIDRADAGGCAGN